MPQSTITALAAAKLQALRVSQGYKRHEIAQRLNKSEQQLFRYERGINKIDLDTLINYCDVLSLDIRDFFGELHAEMNHPDIPTVDNEDTELRHSLDAA
ncbi:helix-turn-helix domain-containing protein [Providencia rettgeri]